MASFKVEIINSMKQFAFFNWWACSLGNQWSLPWPLWNFPSEAENTFQIIILILMRCSLMLKKEGEGQQNGWAREPISVYAISEATDSPCFSGWVYFLTWDFIKGQFASHKHVTFDTSLPVNHSVTPFYATDLLIISYQTPLKTRTWLLSGLSQ